MIDQLAMSRLTVLDEADLISKKVVRTVQYPRDLIAGSFREHPQGWLAACVGGGFILVKIAGALLHGGKKGKKESSTVAGATKKGVFQLALSSLWGMLLASATPVLKQRIQDFISARLKHKFGSPKK